jgi:hypothetical protein
MYIHKDTTEHNTTLEYVRILNSRQNNVDPDHGGICRHGILAISDIRMNH